MADLDVMQAIKDILHENLDIDPANVTAESTLDDLGIDSLDTVELICDLEERCGIEMGYPEGLKSIGDVINYIEEL
jgi:acyl carrier protein